VAGCLVGAAWNNYTEERIPQWDEPAVKKVVEAAGGTYEMADAESVSDTQASQIDQFVAKGAKVIILRAQMDIDGSVPPGTQGAIDRAVAAGVAVIAYEYFIDSPKVLWVNSDEVEAGRMEARAILAAKPKGNYAIIRGTQGSLDDDLLGSGIHEILQPAIDRGDIKIVAETYTQYWDPGTAQVEMTSILAKNQNRIDAVIADWDGMAGGVIAALKEVGLDGKVAVAGQGIDMGSLHNVAFGTETVEVWRDLGMMGTTAGDAAVALCRNPDISKVKGTTPFSSPGHNQIPSLLVKPQAITKDNLNVALEAGWTKKSDLCFLLDTATAPPVCR
jgi:D-xylose transport system substrate-binding protein